ncbi:MAG: HDOD domain-containing protein [Ilumatobacter sp.]|uniref:HDOD domain-containing protein n=1 Tax=Ilumatobacter sp. TaxID=1967498 RepID=UPI002611DA6F|nr:HDOD domain-containing protein [Ilumatobacter sp.]MDJ0767709.1 HDOD domain-containing protein [Ilumatobacter sp.]
MSSVKSGAFQAVVDDPGVDETAANGTATVVFVGSDPAVVEPMRAAMTRRQDVWDVHVVETGQAALALFDELPRVDVVATHVDVSALPVADLLDEVRRISPHTARVVLSGRSDRGVVLGLIGVAHQFVSVPVDIEVLVDLIDHVRSAASTTLRDPVRTLVGRVDHLPSPPAMFVRLGEMILAEDCSADLLANEIAQDVALTGEVLRLVNSSLYGMAERVTSVSRAITLVGLDLIRFVVLGNRLFQPDEDVDTWVDLDRLAGRSRAVALGARALAIRDRASSETSAVAYLTGVVSEIGLLVLGRVPDIAPSIAQPVNVSTYLGAERAIFGGDRFEVGAHLLTLWGFEQPVVDAVRQLSSDETPRAGGLPWYVAASRRLVVEQGFDPHDLASRAGSRHDLDDAIDELRHDADR